MQTAIVQKSNLTLEKRGENMVGVGQVVEGVVGTGSQEIFPAEASRAYSYGHHADFLPSADIPGGITEEEDI